MPRNQNRPPMKNITINLPELYLENIEKLINLNLVPNRSEAVRNAVKEFLQRECKKLEILGFFSERGV